MPDPPLHDCGITDRDRVAALTVEQGELRDHADALEANYRRVEAERDELKTELERTRAEAGRLVGEVVLERDEAVAATADLDTLLEAIAAYKARKEAAHGGPGDLRPLYSTVNEIAKKTGRPGGQDDG